MHGWLDDFTGSCPQANFCRVEVNKIISVKFELELEFVGYRDKNELTYLCC